MAYGHGNVVKLAVGYAFYSNWELAITIITSSPIVFVVLVGLIEWTLRVSVTRFVPHGSVVLNYTKGIDPGLAATLRGDICIPDACESLVIVFLGLAGLE